MTQAGGRFCLQKGEGVLEFLRVGFVGNRVEHCRQVVPDVDEQAAERGGDAGVGWHDDSRDVELPGDLCAMQRARAAEGDQGSSG